MGIYLINDQRIRSDDESVLQIALASVYESKVRPLCLCTETGISMYVARAHGRYLIKRMPNSGSTHLPTCETYEPPAELSGLGEVMGSAIQENPDEGISILKFDFSLSKGGSRAAPTPSDAEADSVKTDGKKLSLRGTLHYLWEEAGLNRWTPAMAGKRSWYVINKYLYQAADNKLAKGMNLSDVLYIPESFSLEKKEEINQRRVARMMKNHASHKKLRRLMIAIGEVKSIAPSRFGQKIILKHLPDCHFMMNDDLHARLLKRFNLTLALWDALPETHLIMIGTFGVSATGIPTLEEVALINVTENWIPFESTFDKALLEALTQAQRPFTKGLRYNLAETKPLACVVLADTPTQATALYICPPTASEETINEMDTLIEESKLASWVWRIGDASMPALPPSKKAAVSQVLLTKSHDVIVA
ncbi:MAG: DUF1173 domain-containing protein [Ottowia sp.]|nr:DUF1173 domain-containing protein [Ottowia sp.]